MSSVFANVQQAPAIQVFALSEACKNDPTTNKVNLTVGAYRTEEGKPWVLPVVKSTEIAMAGDNTLNKEYLPITGLEIFVLESLKLLLGDNSSLISVMKADGVQALGGTGALCLGIQFQRQIMNAKKIYVSNPTWPNHKGISKLAGFEIEEYRYWDAKNKAVDFAGLVDDLSKAPKGSVILLHACAHNPTGMDLNRDQWKKIANLIKSKGLFPFFDIAYQGFASGDLSNDAWAVRYFAEEGFEMFVAQSFSKNFGLYNERVGNLAFITSDPVMTSRVKSQLKVLVRQIWSNPPQHGARIVATVLSTPTLATEWRENVSSMAKRVIDMRQQLYERLRKLNTPGTWDHIVSQIGMFSFTGLTKAQAEYMRSEHHIYLMDDGRINMCGLNLGNLDHVANAINDTVTKVAVN